MKRHLLLLAAFLLLAAGCATKPVPQVAVNPLTYTDIPDNDVIRVGDDYYMVSTTMYFAPVAPIMHSRDLVHWRIVNYLCDSLADDDAWNLRDGRNAYGRGQWATTLREHDGVFYALFIANDQHKTFVFTTTDIQKGEWKRHAVYDRPFHDAGLIFDDGHAYVVWGNGRLMITELEPDLSAIRQGGIDQVLIQTPNVGGLGAEGTHMYHIGDYYYLLEIDWPRGKTRTERAWRSHELLGEYESMVVLQGPFDGRGDGVAQGAIIDTPFGDWYAIMFQDHGAVGRIPTIQPVTWTDGWPMMGDNGVPMKEVTVNLTEDPEGDFVWASDEFDSDKLALVWQWNHNPVAGGWSLSERAGWLRLKANPVAEPEIALARGTLTQRTAGPRCISETKMDFTGMKAGDRAGLCAFQSNYYTIGVTIADDGTPLLTATTRTSAGPRMFETKELLSQPLPEGQKEVWLRMRYVFTPQADDTCGPDKAFASYSLDGTTWTELPEALQMRYTLDFFTGYRSALYSFTTGEAGGYADFDWFHQQTY